MFGAARSVCLGPLGLSALPAGLRAAGCLWILLALVAALLLAGAAPLAAAPPKAPASSGGPPAGATFTIQGITPDAAQEEVRVTFSHPVPLEMVQNRLQLMPPVKIDWRRSSMADNGVLTLRGAWQFGTRYQIMLPEGLRVDGRRYQRTLAAFFLPDLPAWAEFVEAKRVIERDSRQLLQVRVRNVGALGLDMVQVPPILLPLALGAAGSGEQLAADLKEALPHLSPLLAARKALAPLSGQAEAQTRVFTTMADKNKTRAFSLPLTFRPQKEKGALAVIRLTPKQVEGPAAGETRVFAITDLGLTYKLADRSLLVWVSSLKSGAPAAGVQIYAFTQGTEVFPLGRTGEDGTLRFGGAELEGLNLKEPRKAEPVKRAVNPREITLLLAATGDDVAFMDVKPRGDLKAEGIRQGTGEDQLRTLNGAVFTERGVYRPGETINYKGTVREYRAGGRILPPAELPCSFEITSPKGEKVFTREASLSDFGTAAGQVAVQPQWPMGIYTLTMRFAPPGAAEQEADTPSEEEGEPAPGEPVKPKPDTATCTFQVQEFKPPRHFVEVTFGRAARPLEGYVNRSGSQELVRITVSGSYYAGGPVKHGQVRWKIYRTKTSYQVAGFPDYVFGCDDEEKGDLLESGQAILDEQGKTDIDFPLERDTLAGRYGLSVVAAVVDFDGRAVANTKAYQAEPEILVGLSSHPAKIQAGEAQTLKAIVVQKGKALTQGTVRAEVLQQSGGYVPKRNEAGDVYWDYQTLWRQIVSNELNLEKNGAGFNFDFAYGGSYRVACTYTDASGRSYTSVTAYEVSGDFAWDAYENRDKPYQALPLSADRNAYAPGQKAKIRVSPRRPVAYYLVTMEQGELLEHRVVAAKPGIQEIELPLTAVCAPNVYVSVLGVTPRGDFPILPGRYDSEAPGFFWGTLNLPVRLEVEPLTVKISPQKQELKAEPGARVEVEFGVSDPKGQGVEAEMAIAVVDERVLALTAFKTPTLDQLVRFDRPLGVFTGELRTLLMQQTPFTLARSDPLTGGGGLEPGAEGLMGKVRKRFDPVAFFDPAVRTDAAGKATVSFTLPDSLTTYRVYAVVVDRGSRFTSGERPLLAAKDFYLEPGLPGFFTRGDRFSFLVTAFNATGASGPVKFAAQAEGGLKLQATAPIEPLKAKDSLPLTVSGEAIQAGPAQAIFTGEFQGKQDAVAEELMINSGHVRQSAVLFGSLSGAGEIKPALPSYWRHLPWDALGPKEASAVLTFSGSPFLRMTGAIKYLLHYPYGCVEQTASGVMGLAALKGAIQEGLVPEIDVAKVDKYLARGVGRLLSMQVDGGGFGYWPGQRLVHPYGTVYAAVALGVARDQGLEVPEGNLNRLIDYLRGLIKSPNPSGSLKAMAFYALALNTDPDRDVFYVLWNDFPRLSREAKLLVLLAAHQAELLPEAELHKTLKPLMSDKPSLSEAYAEDDFRARYRSPALTLMAAQAILPKDPATEAAALFLLGGLDQEGQWTSTSDTGWALMALADYFHGASFPREAVELTVSQPGGQPQRLRLDPKGFRTLALDPRRLAESRSVKVEAPAGRTVLYKLELTAPRPEVATAGAAHGFKVSKTIANLEGGKVIKVGDLVKVTVRVDAGDRAERYVVLDDPLPAGLVAVNSAFTTEEATPDRDEEDDFNYLTVEGHLRFRPNFFEIKGDRVMAFRDQVWPGVQQFEYFARAVCAGRFVVPATKAAAMYAPGVYGYSPRGELSIEAR